MKTKFTRLYRIWHWLMVFSVLGLLFTVLLRKTFLSYKANALIIQDKLAAMDIDITIESAKVMAKAIRAPMWEWHYIFATFLAISIALRVFLLLSKRGRFPFLGFWKSSLEIKMKKGVFFLLYLVVPIMAISGGVLYYHEALGMSKESVGWIKDFHEYLMYGVIFSVVMHVGMVLKYELTAKKGLISKMIHGEKENS